MKLLKSILLILLMIGCVNTGYAQSSMGDNLGNHRAVRPLDMNGFPIINAPNIILNTDTLGLDDDSSIRGTPDKLVIRPSIITSSMLNDGVVGNFQLSDGAVTLPKIAPGIFAGDVTNASGVFGVKGIHRIPVRIPTGGFGPSVNNFVLQYKYYPGPPVTQEFAWVSIAQLEGGDNAMLKDDGAGGGYDRNADGIVDVAAALSNTNTFYFLNNVKWHKPTQQGKTIIFSSSNTIDWVDAAGVGDMLKSIYDDPARTNQASTMYAHLDGVVDFAETFIYLPYDSTNRIMMPRPNTTGTDNNKVLMYKWNIDTGKYTAVLEEVPNIVDENGDLVMLKNTYLSNPGTGNEKLLVGYIPDNIPGSLLANSSVNSNKLMSGSIRSYHINKADFPYIHNTNSFAKTDTVRTDSDLLGNYNSGLKVIGIHNYDVQTPNIETDNNKVLIFNSSVSPPQWVLGVIGEGGGLSVPKPTNDWVSGAVIMSSDGGLTTYWSTEINLDIEGDYIDKINGVGLGLTVSPSVTTLWGPGINFTQHQVLPGSTNGNFITYEGLKRINVTSGMLWSNHLMTLDWFSRTLAGGAWSVGFNATSGDHVVNYRTSTNLTHQILINDKYIRATNDWSLIYTDGDGNPVHTKFGTVDRTDAVFVSRGAQEPTWESVGDLISEADDIDLTKVDLLGVNTIGEPDLQSKRGHVTVINDIHLQHRDASYEPESATIKLQTNGNIFAAGELTVGSGSVTLGTNKLIVGSFAYIDNTIFDDFEPSTDIYPVVTNLYIVTNSIIVISNADVKAYTPAWIGIQALDIGSNVAYYAIGLTTNDWRGKLLDIVP